MNLFKTPVQFSFYYFLGYFWLFIGIVGIGSVVLPLIGFVWSQIDPETVAALHPVLISLLIKPVQSGSIIPLIIIIAIIRHIQMRAFFLLRIRWSEFKIGVMRRDPRTGQWVRPWTADDYTPSFIIWIRDTVGDFLINAPLSFALIVIIYPLRETIAQVSFLLRAIWAWRRNCRFDRRSAVWGGRRMVVEYNCLPVGEFKLISLPTWGGIKEWSTASIEDVAPPKFSANPAIFAPAIWNFVRPIIINAVRSGIAWFIRNVENVLKLPQTQKEDIDAKEEDTTTETEQPLDTPQPDIEPDDEDPDNKQKPPKNSCQTAIKILTQYQRLSGKFGKKLPPNRLAELNKLRDSGEITANHLPATLRQKFPLMET